MKMAILTRKESRVTTLMIVVIVMMVAVTATAPLGLIASEQGGADLVSKVFASATTATQLTVDPASFDLNLGQSRTITATLTAENITLAGKTVTWSAAYGSVNPSSGVTDNFGRISITYTAPITTTEKWDNIRASFAGDNQYSASFGLSVGHIIPENIPPENKIATSLVVTPSSFDLNSGQSKTLTAMLTTENITLAGRTITWSAVYGNVSPSSGVTDNLGRVSVTYTAPITTTEKWDNIRASFAGDNQYKASVGSSTGHITPENVPEKTSTQLAISPPSFTLELRQPTVLTATLTAENVPLASKTITWSVGPGSIDPASGVTDDQGKVYATYTPPDTRAEVWDNITATFAGDNQYQASTGHSYAHVLPENIPPENTPPENIPPENLPPENTPFWIWRDNVIENLRYRFDLPENERPWIRSPENENRWVRPEENVENAVVSAIELTIAKTTDNVMLIVAHVDKPAEVQIPSGKVVYYYLEISTSAEESISGATVEFKIDKSWIDANGIDKGTIKLLRYDNGWQPLITSITGEDERYIYCSAETSGFSLFAATGEKAAAFPLLVVVAGVLAAAGIVVLAVWLGIRQARGDAASILVERGLPSMRITEVDIFSRIRTKKEFTIPELMQETHVSKTIAWRTVQKLITKGLVEPTGEIKPAAGGLGGRGKPSKVYRYVGD